MAANILTLIDNENNEIYPQTKAEAVFLNDNRNVETVLNLKVEIPEGEEGQLLAIGSNNSVTSVNQITVSTSVTSTSTTTAASSSAVKSAYDLASDAMPKTGGTFTGTIRAGNSYQSYSTYLLRNTRLVSSDITPAVNGQICWTYG